MSIHSGNPFADPDSARNPLRRLRARLPQPVSLWTHGTGPQRTGLTVSSMLVADGDPGELLALVDEESDLADALLPGAAVAVSLLGPGQQAVADVFAGLAPSPGGPFRTGSWTDTDWGPVLADAVGWIGARVVGDLDDHAGWARLLRAEIEQLELADRPSPAEPLLYLRGRYRRLAD